MVHKKTETSETKHTVVEPTDECVRRLEEHVIFCGKISYYCRVSVLFNHMESHQCWKMSSNEQAPRNCFILPPFSKSCSEM